MTVNELKKHAEKTGKTPFRTTVGKTTQDIFRDIAMSGWARDNQSKEELALHQLFTKAPDEGLETFRNQYGHNGVEEILFEYQYAKELCTEIITDYWFCGPSGVDDVSMFERFRNGNL